MQFELKNIGKVKNASLKMNGITVLAGENRTGKSTFGKALYCIFNAFYKLEEGILKERTDSIEEILFRFMRRPNFRSIQVNKIAKNIVDNDDSPLGIQVHHILEDALENRILVPSKMTDDSIGHLLEKIHRSLDIGKEQIQKNIVTRYLYAEFGEQITHVNQPGQDGTILLAFKDEKFTLSVTIQGGECTAYESKEVDIMHRAFYIDTPFILDKIGLMSRNDVGHRQELLRCLQKLNPHPNAVNVEVTKQQLKNVLNRINGIVPGEFRKTESGRFGFQESGLDKPLEFVNVSAGMKFFLIIRMLLETTRELSEEDVLILDEPEVHLHPEWQIKFAELLVLVQKEFNLTILLTTHSPYFLNAIEVFSDKYNIAARCNYYLTADREGACIAEDVTENTDGVYRILAKPFRTLEKIRYAD